LERGDGRGVQLKVGLALPEKRINTKIKPSEASTELYFVTNRYSYINSCRKDMSTETTQCNFDDPASVVKAFIAAMNGWELKSWQSSEACRNTSDPSAYQPGVLRELENVFALYCTPKERRFGRNGSFQEPPEYDPTREGILGADVDEIHKRAYVTTQRETVLGGGRYKYALLRTEGKWLIDTLKHEFGGDWKNHIL
jgi:hypothetical protein